MYNIHINITNYTNYYCVIGTKGKHFPQTYGYSKKIFHDK